MVHSSNKQIVLLDHPTGFPIAGEHLGVHTTQLNTVLEEDEILLRNLFVSVDPCKSLATTFFQPALDLKTDRIFFLTPKQTFVDE